jgi:hypothetical protein
MFEFYLNNLRASVKNLHGFLTICFKLCMFFAIFCSGMYYANSDTECQVTVRTGGDVHVIYGVKPHG